MQQFQLVSDKVPGGDQPEAINHLTAALQSNQPAQVLLGATGTGKTFTIANIIQNVQKPTLVLAHNKTLAGQLYAELKSLFPNNQVEYFISYFDYYQPEAYLPSTDTFIEKSSISNEIIAMMRLSTLTALSTRKDVIVVASVACIYPSTAPDDFAKFQLVLKINDPLLTRSEIISKLVMLNYERNDLDLTSGRFRIRGDVIELIPGHNDQHLIRLSFFGDELEEIALIEPLNLTIISKEQQYLITPANEYIMEQERKEMAMQRIRAELKNRARYFAKKQMFLEEHRILQRTNHDLESLTEFGVCQGIENYAFHLELREEGSTPYTLFDYFGDDWLLVVDESHITIPQVRGMYNTDISRKNQLVKYGFRLPSALHNRPLNFEEFLNKIKQVIYVSATPNDWEIAQANHQVVEQIVRPTGLVDPQIIVRTSVGQLDDLVAELRAQKLKQHRTLVTVLTIRLAEELTAYLREKQIKVAYLHNELKTLERDKVLNDLRRGVYDVVVGINLLREGLDLPEVSLVCIFDANKPGFFRSDKSLIQIIGRAARNAEGRVIMYADSISDAMATAIKETERRRNIQIAYNKAHNIVPKTIIKTISDDLENIHLISEASSHLRTSGKNRTQKTIATLEKEMQAAADAQEYELAAHLRDQIIILKTKGANKTTGRKKK